MIDEQWQYLVSVNIKYLFLFYGMKMHSRHPRVWVMMKKVSKTLSDLGLNMRSGIEWKILSPSEVQWSDIIHPRHVVIVFVGHQDSVQVIKASLQHLLTKIRSGIHSDPAIIPFQDDRCSKPLVPWIR